MQLRTCSSCQGLAPEGADRCPHCDARRARGGRLARRLLGLVAGTGTALTLMACYGVPAGYDRCYDNDGDGYFPACYQATCAPGDVYCDCDDDNPAIHYGAPDPVGDGIDSDCDGKDGPRPGTPPDAGAGTPDAWIQDGGARPGRRRRGARRVDPGRRRARRARRPAGARRRIRDPRRVSARAPSPSRASPCILAAPGPPRCRPSPTRTA